MATERHLLIVAALDGNNSKYRIASSVFLSVIVKSLSAFLEKWNFQTFKLTR